MVVLRAERGMSQKKEISCDCFPRFSVRLIKRVLFGWQVCMKRGICGGLHNRKGKCQAAIYIHKKCSLLCVEALVLATQLYI